MKRITLIIASLFFTMGAMAQVKVTDLNQLSNDKKYFIESERCFLMYKPSASETALCTSNATRGDAVTKKMSDAAQQFNIINENGSYYLYSIAAAKYVNKSGNFVADKADAMTIENVGGNYQWKLCIGGNGLNSQIPNQMDCGIVVNSWTNTDAGNSYTILDVTDYVEPVYVSSPEEITSTALYTIAPKDNGRGVLFANSTSTHLTTTALANQDINDVNQQFMFITKDEKTYLYSVGANKFVNDEGKYLNLTAAPKHNITVESADVEGYLFVKMNGVDMINVSTGWNYGALADWNTADDGNRLRIRYVDEASEELLAEIEELFSSTAEVTYKFVCNGVTLATQTATVSKGEAFPAFNVTLPLGYEITEQKPEGTVTASVAEEITVAVNNALLPFEAVAEGTPSKWYYAQMHAHGGYQWFIAPDGEGIATRDHKFVANEVDAHLWGFVGTVESGFKMVNYVTKQAIKSENSGVATMVDVADATAFTAMASKTNGWFCLRHPQGNYLNSQSNAINHWYDNDNGSSIKLTEYVDEDVTVSVSDLNWATKYFGESVHVPAGVNAYIITGAADGYVTKEQIAEGEVIPANTGVLLENAGEHKFAKTVSYNYTLAGNLLNGSVENTYVEGEAYVLANHSEAGLGFYKAELNMDADGNKVGVETGTHFLNNAGKAYLVLPAASETVAFYGLDWEGTTGVENVVVENEVKAIFDLTGRKVETINAPGIYIVNGKKTLVK